MKMLRVVYNSRTLITMLAKLKILVAMCVYMEPPNGMGNILQ